MLSENICPFNTGSSDNKHEHHSPESKYSCKREWRIKFKYDSFKHTLRPRLSSLKEAFCSSSYSAAKFRRLNGFSEGILSIDCEDIFR